jgi:hypothetical protein
MDDACCISDGFSPSVIDCSSPSSSIKKKYKTQIDAGSDIFWSKWVCDEEGLAVEFREREFEQYLIEDSSCLSHSLKGSKINYKGTLFVFSSSTMIIS